MDVLKQQVKPGAVNDLGREMIWCLRGKDKNREDLKYWHAWTLKEQNKGEEIN